MGIRLYLTLCAATHHRMRKQQSEWDIRIREVCITSAVILRSKRSMTDTSFGSQVRSSCEMRAMLTKANDFRNGPHMLTDTRFHRWGNPQGLMDPRKVVVNMKDRQRMNMIFNLLTEAIT